LLKILPHKWTIQKLKPESSAYWDGYTWELIPPVGHQDTVVTGTCRHTSHAKAIECMLRRDFRAGR
jgi:hypothetical protein